MAAQARAPGAEVGFVGLGAMGRPMARNLAAAGYRLTVRDAEPERQASFASTHACTAAETVESFAAATVVVTMLPDDRDVREALLDWRGGIVSALSPGAVVVDMSSSNPAGTKELGELLSGRGVGLVDAPVSGGVTRAEAGTLTLMIGAREDAVARAPPCSRY
jgi:3-hydroxyisobutyrate dehydrogenase